MQMKKSFSLFFFMCFVHFVFAQNNWQVSGLVVDAEDEQVLIGVSIAIQGLSQGTVTDTDGNFVLSVPKGSSLVFSYVGYISQTVAVKGDGLLNIKLRPDVHMLDEVVAIGYGSMKKSDLTGAVGSISGDKLRAAPVARVDQALQGRMAGVTVNSNSGQPGEDAIIRIRGIGTINDASPIYVVDGIVTDNIKFLSTSDIASVEVLKDASSAAIYGSRGANGVILITTKKGSNTGKTNITFESYLGTQNRWKKLDVMGRDEFANTAAILAGTRYPTGGRRDNEKLEVIGLNAWIGSHYAGKEISSGRFPQILELNDDGSIKTPGIDYTLIDTDWQDEIFVKDASMQNYYLSMDGGSDKHKYMMSLNYFDQQGTLIGTYYNRLTLRLNTSFKVREWLLVGENLSFTNSHSRGSINNSLNAGLVASVFRMSPWDPLTYPEGTVDYKGVDLSGQYTFPSLWKDVTHPYNMMYNSKPFPSDNDWVGDAYLEITPIKGLLVRGDVNMKLWNGVNRTYTPVLDVPYRYITRNGVSASMTNGLQLTYEGMATYNTKFKEIHDITLMAGASAEETNQYSVNASGQDLIFTDEKNWYINKTPDTIVDGASTRSGGDSVSKGRLASFFGRVHYSFANKYLLTANIRYDGSSKFRRGYAWGTFPSAAAAWKISEESFFESLKEKVDFMKIRLGWGQLGNMRSVREDSFLPNVATGNWGVGYPFGNTPTAGMSLNFYPLLGSWERTEQTDLGIDFGLFHDLFYGTIDLYRRDTKDMLMNIQQPGNVGFRYNPTGNAATVRNQGIEFTLEHKKKIGDVFYSVAGNVSFIHNELVKLNAAEPLWDGIILNDEGLPLNTIYTLVYDGVFQTQEEIDNYTWTDSDGVTKKIQPDAFPGDARYLDTNNDGKIDANDRTDVGNPFPWMTYGFNASLNYKGFDFQVFFQGVTGNEVYNYLRQGVLEFDGASGILSTDMRNVYYAGADPDDLSHIINLMPGSNGTIPNPVSKNVQNKESSSRYVEDASYLRLKNLQLGYTLPAKITNKFAVDRLRIYVAGSNLLTFTKYKGYDPEVGDNGRDGGNFPQARTFLVGLNMNF
jgi:TonB-linked SusC/RagA family outer membrane protein